MKFKTATGSVYNIDEQNLRVRRMPNLHSRDMRQDYEWVGLQTMPNVEVGYAVSMQLEPLAEDATTTIRTTSPVVEIWY